MKRSPTAALLAMSVLSALLPPSSPARGQETGESVTLAQALSFFAQNSPELQLARSRLRSALGGVLQGRAVPNPRLAITHEALGDYSESYLNLTQEVDFLWERGDRKGRADALGVRARAQFLADSARLELELKRSYIRAWQSRDELEAHRQADGVIADLLSSAEARFAEGDLAGYDLRRLRFERAQSSRRTAAALLELEDSERRLGAFLVGSNDYRRISAEGLDTRGVSVPSEGELVAEALRRRPEILSAGSFVEAMEAEASLANSSVFRGSSLTGGVKRQADGLDGLFFGLELPLPLSDRRQGARDAARANVMGAESEVDLLRRAVARQVSSASTRLETAKAQLEILGSTGIQEAQELLAIARLAFSEGETSVVELLDAAGAFFESRLLDTQLQGELWMAYFELEQAVGGFPAGNDNGVSGR